MRRCFSIILCCVLNQAFAGPKVNISQGILEGKISVTGQGKLYHSYLGIPYAKPPINELRFQNPRKPDHWTDIFEATRFGNACVAVDVSNVIGDEDCLFLNVYTPCITKECTSLLPVIFHIHGGGLIAGSGDSVRNAPDWIVEHDIVVVTTNYRLGVFGFLSLDIAEAPGNLGLKDQVAALRWVKENIMAFGGDPDDVTITGVSAGAASVNYLYLTDTTDGLFRKAIQISGSALNPWTYLEDPKRNAYKLCEALGHNPSSEQNALNFLLNIPASDLILAVGLPPLSTISSDENMPLRNTIFLPTAENTFPGKTPFMTEPPLDKLKSKNFQKVPLFIGYCTGEGILGVPDARLEPENFGLLNIDFERYVPKEMCLEKGSRLSKETASDIKEFYYSNISNTNDNCLNYINIKGDTWFKRGINNVVELVSETSSNPVYYYQFSFDEYSDFKIRANTTQYKGAMHANNENYIFYSTEFPKNDTRVELTRQRMLQLFTNFIKTGNPTPEITDIIPLKWEPVTKKNLYYLNIDEHLALEQNPDKGSMQFWKDLINNGNNRTTD